MDVVSWILGNWWVSILIYLFAFAVIVAFSFRTALAGFRADARADTDTGADTDSDTDSGAVAKLYADDYGDAECRDHLARFAGGATRDGSILRPCGCPYIGPPFDDCPSFLADEAALK